MKSKYEFLYDHKLRKFKKAPRIVNARATAKFNRKHYIAAGESVYVISIQGKRIEFYKLSEDDQPITDTIYVDKKSLYILPL